MTSSGRLGSPVSYVTVGRNGSWPDDKVAGPASFHDRNQRKTLDTFTVKKSLVKITRRSASLHTHMPLVRSPLLDTGINWVEGDWYAFKFNLSQLINPSERQSALPTRVRPRKQGCVRNTWKETNHPGMLRNRSSAHSARRRRRQVPGHRPS